MTTLPSQFAIEFAIFEIADYSEKMRMKSGTEMACTLTLAAHIDRLRDAVDRLATAAAAEPQSADQIRAALAEVLTPKVKI